MQLTNFEKFKALPWQLAGHVLTTVFVRTDFYGGAMFMLFLSELKLDKSRIGFLMSLLAAFGFLSLFFAPMTARVGFKNSYMSFVIGRLLFVAPLLLLPYIVSQYGTQYGFWLLVASMSCFALLKAFGEVAWVPWTQEVVPDTVRGKFNALVNVGTQLSSIIVTAFAGYLVGKMVGLTPFIMMIYFGLIAGVLSIWCYAKMPAGSSVPSGITSGAHFREMLESITKDKNFLLYNLAISIVFVGFYIASTFVPLFLKEEIGLPSRVVVWLDIANFAGSMLSCYFWGWASDRYGSKPVMLIGPIIWLVFPVICIFMPHQRTIATVLGLMTMGIIGVGTMAWVLGINRYLYVTAMPEEKRTGYSAVYYANQTFAVCLGPLISGVMIDKMSLMRNWFAQYSVSPYMPVFALGFLGLLGGTILMGGVRSSGELTLYSFVRLFLRRDSVRSCLAIMQVRFAKTEQKRAKVALVLRHLENPLVKHEIDLLRIDPSALVRLAMSGDCASVSDLVRSSDTGAELADNESFLRITEKLGSTADAAEALDLTYTLAKRFCRQEQFYSCWKQLNDDPATGAASLFWKLRGEFARFFADTAFLALSMETSDKYARREFALANALAAELALKLSAKDHSAAHVLKACSFRLSRSADIDIASLAFLSCLPLKEPMHCL